MRSSSSGLSVMVIISLNQIIASRKGRPEARPTDYAVRMASDLPLEIAACAAASLGDPDGAGRRPRNVHRGRCFLVIRSTARQPNLRHLARQTRTKTKTPLQLLRMR